jgi:hypothetical protein
LAGAGSFLAGARSPSLDDPDDPDDSEDDPPESDFEPEPAPSPPADLPAAAVLRLSVL